MAVIYEEWIMEVSEVPRRIDAGELIIDPAWQRGRVWGVKDERLLIDSILLRMPIPKFYVAYEYDKQRQVSKYRVVDGQQRLSAINRFLRNQFAIEIEIDGRWWYWKDLDSKTRSRLPHTSWMGTR